MYVPAHTCKSVREACRSCPNAQSRPPGLKGKEADRLHEHKKNGTERYVARTMRK